MSTTRIRATFLLAAAMAVGTAAEVNLSGTVYDAQGNPEPNVIVRLAQAGLADTTDHTGAYVLSDATAARNPVSRTATAEVDVRGGAVYLRIAGARQRVRARAFSLCGRILGELCDASVEPGTYLLRPGSLSGRSSGLQTLVVELCIGDSRSYHRVMQAPRGRDGQPLTRLGRDAQGLAAGKAAEEPVDTLVLRKLGQEIGCQPVTTLIGQLASIFVVQRDIYGSFTPGFTATVDSIASTVTEGDYSKLVPLWYNTANQSYSGFVYFFFVQQVQTYSVFVSVYDADGRLTGRSTTIEFTNLAGDIEVPAFSPDNAVPVVDAGPDTTGFPGDSITLHAVAADSIGGGTLAWEWDIGATGVFAAASGGDTTFAIPETDDSVLVCVVRVTDGHGLVAVDSVRVRVKGAGDAWFAAPGSDTVLSRIHAPLVAHNDELWVIGGWDSLTEFAPCPECSRRDVWSTADGESWTQLTDALPFTCFSDTPYTAVSYNGRVHVLGGWLDAVWSSADGATWESGGDSSRFWSMGGVSAVVCRDTL